jgi:ATP-dependent exoDNAse (exonuclease V) beta subunit
VSLPPDHEARARVVSGRDRSLLVEASAGTGKTHAIIEAVVERCARASPRVPLTRIAAVTFTEKAAGELQDRLRRRLADLSGSPGEGEAVRAAARESLEEIDRAQVGTIHAFCASLLRERPIEAGLIPAFRMLLPEASAALARLVWEEWWREEVGERPDGPLGTALRRGLKLVGGDDETTIETLAAALYEKRARVQDARLPEADAARIVATARAWLPDLVGLETIARNEGHRVAETLLRIGEWIEGLPADFEGLAAAASLAPKISFTGTRSLPAVAEWREAEYDPFVERLRAAADEPMFVALLRRLAEGPGSYLDAVARRKRRESLLDFDDLLLAARQLLRHSSAARTHFRQRYALIVVDEFQDTDPVQMEIILRLAHADGSGDWTKLVPQPGRLLLVGDPKQSIYRFRRADLETYTLVRTMMGPNRETFVANRRSVSPLLEWVNVVFGEAMAPPVRPFEAPYSPVEPWGNRRTAEEKRIVYLDPPPDWRAGEEKWRTGEAQAVAMFLAEAIGAGSLRVGDEGRPARAGDVAVLVRANEGIAFLQEAITAAGLDAIVDGGLDFFRREEPAAVLAALRAIDNPHDAIALYAGLKSFLFAISDEELFLAREAGAAFDHRRAELASGALREALDLLSRLYRRRDERRASETILDLFAATGAFVKARARRVGGLQAHANLHQLVSLARSLEETAPSFGDVVRGLLSIGRADLSEPRAFEEKPDAVRILTVHKAKGLEFPVVVLAGFGSSGRPGAAGLLVPQRDGEWGATIKRGKQTIATPDFALLEAADLEREQAETRRLLYVAATRAEDWFVLSRWRNVTESKKGTVSDPFDRTSLPLLGPVALTDELASLVDRRTALVPARPRAPRRRKVDPVAAERLRREIDEIRTRSDRLSAARSAPLRRAGGGDAASEDRPGFENGPAEEPSVAARIGCAVHRAMEIVVAGGEPGAAVAAAAAEWELAIARHAEIRGMVATLTKSAPASGARRFAEFPVLFRSPEDGALVEGKIDLLIEGTGGWTIVDWKTDRLDRLRGETAMREHFEKYRPQLREYAAALKILGVPVARACVVSARSGDVFDLL